MKTKLLVPLCVVALAGCVSTTHVALDQIKEPSLLQGATAQSVKVAPEFFAHTDAINVGGKPLWIFPTGQVAQKIFTGGADCPWTIEVLTTQLTLDQKDDMPIPVFTTTARFSVSCVLKGRGKQIPLSTTAAGETRTDVPLAIRMAVERALLDISKQVAAASSS